MDESWRDRRVKKLTSFMKKHKHLKILIMIWMVVICLTYGVIHYFATNGKRFIGIAFVLLFFSVSSSFSFPSLVESTGSRAGYRDTIAKSGQNENVMVQSDENENVIVQSDEIDYNDSELILDDEDVLDGYENSELDSQDVDLYTTDEILEENDGSAVTDEAAADTEDMRLDLDDWRLVLINKQHPVPDDYEFTLGTIKGSMKCDERIIGDLLNMLQGAKDDNVNLVICSPYRDYKRQEVLFNRKIEVYMSKGMSYMESYKLTSQAVTVPGASEHQIGLALDIVSDSYTSLNAGFGDSEAGKWLAEHSCEYGFILRYPEGKETVTGIEYEPWHFRYVGKDAATIITDENITLEELVESL